MNSELIIPNTNLLARYAVPGPRYTSYPTVPSWSKEPNAFALVDALETGARTGNAALYVHLPFCKSLCWYCGCNVVISKDAGHADKYIDSLALELEAMSYWLGKDRALSQIHWGGGTPTFLTEPQIERLWKEITSRFRLASDAEVSIEVHPTHTTASQVTLLHGLGFNRMSIGLQDFDPHVQQATGRKQTVEQTWAILDHARTLGFGGINFDLIYGLPAQTEGRWAKTLETVLALKPDRLAVYSFAFVPQMLKHQRRMNARALPNAQLKLDLFVAAYRAFVDAGYDPIAMDHFALPTDGLAKAQREKRLGRNFQGYSERADDPLIAVGATAISNLGGVYAQNIRSLPRYYERVAATGFATEKWHKLSDDDVRRRRIIQALMCQFEVELSPDEMNLFADELERLKTLEDDGIVRCDDRRIEVTALGRWFVRNVAMVFDAYLGPVEARRFSQTV